MAINRSWLEELPAIPATQAWRSDERRGFFNERAFYVDPLRVRSLYWTLRISDEAEQWNRLAQALPGYQWVQVGFLAPSENSPLYARAGENFGLLVCCDDQGAEQRQLRQRVEVDGVSFPIGVMTAWFEPHVQVTSPNAGCVAGWAHSRRASSRPHKGWLTAGHVVPSSQSINFSDGGSGNVVDRAATCVDAAVVSTDRPPANPRLAHIASSLTAGDAVELHDQYGSALPMTIHSVDPTLGTTASRHLPLRFSLDKHGRPGDSGASIDDPASGDINGLYLGRYVDYQGSGTALGVGLAAHYLAAVMDMEIAR